MPGWNLDATSGVQMLIDDDGTLLGYINERGKQYLIPQTEFTGRPDQYTAPAVAGSGSGSIPDPINASIIPRTGVASAIEAVAGFANEIALATDTNTLYVLSGVAAGAVPIGGGGSATLVDTTAWAAGINTYSVASAAQSVHFKLGGNGVTQIDITLPGSPAAGKRIRFSCDYSATTGFKFGIASAGLYFDTSQSFTVEYGPQIDGSKAWKLVESVQIGSQIGLTGVQDIGLGTSLTTTAFGAFGGVATALTGGAVGGGGSLALGQGAVARTTLGGGAAFAVGPSAPQAIGNRAGAYGRAANASADNATAVTLGSQQGIASAIASIAYGVTVANINSAGRSVSGASGASSRGIFEFALYRTGLSASAELSLDAAPASGTALGGNRWCLPSVATSAAYTVTADVVGRVSGTAKVYRARKTCLVVCDGTTVSIVGSVSDTITPFQSGLSNNLSSNTGTLTNVVTVTADNTNRAINVSVVQDAATDGTMSWTAHCEVRRVQ